MNRVFRIITLVSLSIILSGQVDAQENKSNWYVTGSAGIYSCYALAGVMYGGVSFYPHLETGYSLSDDFSICGAAGAITDFNAELYLPGSVPMSFSCLEYSLGCHWKSLSVNVNDMVYGFKLSDKSAHFLGVMANWTLSEKYPLSTLLYTVIGSTIDVNAKGKPAYSTLVDISYPFTIGKHISLGPEIAIVPWASTFFGYDSFALCQLGAQGSYTFSLGDRWALPLTLNAGWNPALKNFYWYTAILISFM